MKKGLVTLLILGLLLTGVTPVLAAGERVKPVLAIQQEGTVQVVLPAVNGLPDDALALVNGAYWPFVVAGVVLLNSLHSCSVKVDINSDGNPEFEGTAEYGEPRVPMPARK